MPRSREARKPACCAVSHAKVTPFHAGYECPDPWIYDATSNPNDLYAVMGVESRESAFPPSRGQHVLCPVLVALP